jgi:hypothetical protein
MGNGLKRAFAAARATHKVKQDTFHDMFGILNDHGSLWSRHTFADEGAAQKYLREHDLNKTCDLSKHRVVPVSVTIRIKG